jgi:hypothetical protein
MSAMPSPTPPVTRHALGLPAGSIRALLALMVVALICLLLLFSDYPLPVYLLYLLFMILGHFFAAHGNSIAGEGSQGNPLHLPRGSIRLLILGMLIATVAYEYAKDPDALGKQLTGAMEEAQKLPMLPVVLLGGFFLGVILHTLVGRHFTPYWFKDVEAWVALLAFLGLGIEVMIHLVINPTLETPLRPYTWQAILAAIITFYFGARS